MTAILLFQLACTLAFVGLIQHERRKYLRDDAERVTEDT